MLAWENVSVASQRLTSKIPACKERLEIKAEDAFILLLQPSKTQEASSQTVSCTRECGMERAEVA